MSKKENRVNIIIKNNDALYLLCSFLKNESGLEIFNIASNNKYEIETHLKQDSKSMTLTTISEKSKLVKGKNKYISYHISGQVNYNGYNEPSMKFEKLANITKENCFFILSFSKLTTNKPLNDDFINNHSAQQNFIYDITTIDSLYVNFKFIVAPKNQFINYLSFIYDDIFSFSIIADINQELAKTLACGNNTSINFMIPKGEPKTDVNLNKVMLEYKRAVHKQDKFFIYKYDNEIFEMVFDEMRCRPKLKIEFKNQRYKAKIVNDNDSQISLKFCVYDKHGNKVVDDLGIKSIILDAEIYEEGHVLEDGWI